MMVTMRENFSPYQKVEFYCEFFDNNTVIVDTGDPIPNNSYVVTLIA